MTTDKRGVSALPLQRQLALQRYETAWMMLHKFRRAMGKPAPMDSGIGSVPSGTKVRMSKDSSEGVPLNGAATRKTRPILESGCTGPDAENLPAIVLWFGVHYHAVIQVIQAGIEFDVVSAHSADVRAELISVGDSDARRIERQFLRSASIGQTPQDRGRSAECKFRLRVRGGKLGSYHAVVVCGGAGIIGAQSAIPARNDHRVRRARDHSHIGHKQSITADQVWVCPWSSGKLQIRLKAGQVSESASWLGSLPIKTFFSKSPVSGLIATIEAPKRGAVLGTEQ
jgi:hypothetical protein